jgi:hypothetical protein
VFVARYDEKELRAVVPDATSMTDVLRHFGQREREAETFVGAGVD